MDHHRFVFLAGLHRSGTTLLGRLIAAHPEVSGFSGTGAPAEEGQHLQTVYPPATAWGGPGSFGFSPEAYFTEAQASPEQAQQLFAEWSPYWDLSRPVLVEKSPPNLLKTRYLQALFPRSSFVVVLRHPIAASMATVKFRPTRRLGRMIAHWLRCYETFEADKPQLERVHVVRYEDLVREPEPVLRGVFDFLGLDPVPPSEPVEAGADERYFAQWQALKRDPRMRAYLDLSELRYQRRAGRFGYTLFRPGR
jgi:hypothetical protein